MSQHTNCQPDDCTSCVKIFGALTSHIATGGGKLTAAALASLVDLGERALRVHLGHLVEHGRLSADRRTPVEGATVGRPASPPVEEIWTPLDWVATVAVRDRTCRRILILLARRADVTWGGQMGLEEIADAVGLSVWTVSLHRRKHLVPDRHMEVIPNRPTKTASGLPVREADRYLLCAGQQRTPLLGANWAEDAALDVLTQVRWFMPGSTADERQRGAWKIKARMRSGWTAAQLVQRLDIVPDRRVISRLKLLSTLLPEANEVPGVPLIEHVTGAPAGPICCPSCGHQFPSQSAAYPGLICRECRAKARAESAATSAVGAYASQF